MEKFPVLILLCSVLVFCPSLKADSTIEPASSYAWVANAGWVNFHPNVSDGTVFGGAFLSGYAWSANTGWIDFGDATPANGYAYSNTSSDHGVNHDGAGNLGGYAWSANTGWINFGWADVDDVDRPRVDLLTGDFTGYVWSANIGWINLGLGRLATATMQTVDSDGDDIADHWEWEHFGNLTLATALSDYDGDGATDIEEYLADSDPEDPGDYLKIVSQTYNPAFSQNSLEFTSQMSRLYRIEFSNNLGVVESWGNSSLGLFVPDEGNITAKLVSFPSNTRKFFRVRANLPLKP